MVLRVAVLCGCLLTSGVAWTQVPGDDLRDHWHHWRGPLATGVAPKADPPIEWDVTKNIKWKTAPSGRGSATPIVWGHQIFVVTAIKTDRAVAAKDLPKIDPGFKVNTKAPDTLYRFVVMSFDRHTGKLIWKDVAAEKVPHEGHHPSHS